MRPRRRQISGSEGGAAKLDAAAWVACHPGARAGEDRGTRDPHLGAPRSPDSASGGSASELPLRMAPAHHRRRRGRPRLRATRSCGKRSLSPMPRVDRELQPTDTPNSGIQRDKSDAIPAWAEGLDLPRSARSAWPGTPQPQLKLNRVMCAISRGSSFRCADKQVGRLLRVCARGTVRKQIVFPLVVAMQWVGAEHARVVVPVSLGWLGGSVLASGEGQARP